MSPRGILPFGNWRRERWLCCFWGLGLGIVSLHTLQQELTLNLVKLLNVKEMPIMRIWYIVHQKQKVVTPAMQVFMNFVSERTESIWIEKYPGLGSYL